MQVLLLLTAASLGAASVPDLAKEFDTWASSHKKQYGTTEERLQRFEVWSKNRGFVNAHNAEEQMGFRTYRMKLNHLGDLSRDEYRSLLGYRHTQSSSVQATLQSLPYDAPASWDWRPKGIVNDVKNQGQCGSCWSFSATAAMEGAYNFKNNGTVDKLCKGNTCGPNSVPCCSFSEQEVVDCTLAGKDNCNTGGNPADGVSEIGTNMKGVFNTEDEYPYTSGDGTSNGKCTAKTAGVQTGITGFTNTKSGDESALKLASSQHVLSIGIDASQQSFQFYSSGVYVEPACKNGPDDLDHGVAIVGYGTWSETEVGTKSAGQDYWIVRNSWGDSYGMDGYILMARNKDNQCGVATAPLYANIGSVDSTSAVLV